MQQTMANYDQTNYNNWNAPQGQHAAPSYNFDMPEQFGGELYVVNCKLLIIVEII